MTYSPLDLVENYLRRFVIYPSDHAVTAHVLWIAGATATRCTNHGSTVTDYICYAPVAVAGLHKLPDTLASRSIFIHMQRAAPDEEKEQLSGAAKDDSLTSGVELLAHIRDAFLEAEKIWTTTLLQRLCDREESPWADIRGKALGDRGLADRLRPYGIK
jgi:hypothetical protein